MAEVSDLIQALETAPAGSRELSRRVFLALGGEFRTSPASNQGGSEVTLPYWPGEKHAAMGISFTTNLNDVAHWLSRSGLYWAIEVAPDQVSGCVGLATSWVSGEAATPCLALCAALLRFRQEKAP